MATQLIELHDDIVGLKDLKQIQRWDLTTLEREVTVAAPEGGVAAIAMGANATTPLLLTTIRSGGSLSCVPGIAYRERGVPRLTAPAAPIQDLDAFRVGWELIDELTVYCGRT